MKRISKKHIIFIIILLFIAIVFIAKGGEKRLTILSPKNNIIATIAVEKIKIPEFYRATGTVKPVVESNLSAQITAKIDKVLAVPGEKVKQGQALIILDSRDLETKVERANQGINSAKAVYEQAKLNLDRMTKLINQGYVTKSQFDNSRATFLQAEANLNQANKALNEAQIALSYAVIKAPTDGVILNKYVDVGDQAMPGKTLLQFQAKNAFRLVANVPEELITRIKVGQHLNVKIDSINTSLQGVVSEIVPSIDPMTRSFLVKVDIPTTTTLYPGMFGYLSIPVREVDVLAIPQSAVIVRGQLKYVMVVKNNQRQLTLITTGKKLDNNKIQLLSGLNADDKIALTGAVNGE